MLARHPLGLHYRGRPGTWRGALRPHTGDARLPALAPWRFWAPVPRFSRRSLPPLSLRQVRLGCSEAPRVRVVVPGGRLSFASRGERLRAATAGRHSSLRIQVWLENTPQTSEDANLYYERFL